MRHAGRQKADAGQLLAPHHLLGAHLHLAVEVVANFLEPGGHVVHGLGQFGHLVAGVEADAVAELAGRHATRAGNQHPQRAEDPAVREPHEEQKDQRRRHRRRPFADDQRGVSAPHLVGEAGQLRVQVAGQFRGQRLQLFQLHVEPIDLDVVEHPVFVAVGLADAFNWASILRTVSSSRSWSEMLGVGPCFAGQLIPISHQSLIDFDPTASELVADHPHRAPDRERLSGNVFSLWPAHSPMVIRRSLTWRLSSAASGSSLHAPTQAVDQVAVGVRGHQPGARQDRNDQDQQAQPQEQFSADRPRR